MSLHEYEESRAIEREDRSFYGLIMAAMRRADTDNLERLKAAFPETWAELQDRYRSPGGRLASERA